MSGQGKPSRLWLRKQRPEGFFLTAKVREKKHVEAKHLREEQGINFDLEEIFFFYRFSEVKFLP